MLFSKSAARLPAGRQTQEIVNDVIKGNYIYTYLYLPNTLCNFSA